MPGNWASKQASKLSSVVVEFVRKDRRVLLGCPFLPFVPFSSRPLSFTSIVDDSRDDLIRGQYRHRFRRSFLSFFAYSHSLILSQFFLFLRFEFFLFFFFLLSLLVSRVRSMREFGDTLCMTHVARLFLFFPFVRCWGSDPNYPNWRNQFVRCRQSYSDELDIREERKLPPVYSICTHFSCFPPSTVFR